MFWGIVMIFFQLILTGWLIDYSLDLLDKLVEQDI